MTTGRGSKRWYVVHTKPKQEGRAETNLQAWGIETLSPRLRERRYSARHPSAFRIAPLFPQYIFARFEADSLLSKVRLTRGVHDVVGFGEYATPVADEIITLIRNRLSDGGFVTVAEPVPGDLVSIEAGPLRSLVGVFEREMRGRDRVMVLLTTVGANARVQLPKAFIRKARSGSAA